MTDMTPDAQLALRRPFPADSVGRLPKPYKADSPKGNCQECDGYHGLPALHLDYVGHAAVTDRLLTVDPNWSWEPFAIGPDGLPAVVGGNLWIRLTVCGVTRIGVGDGKNAKECIGDAIRNAAMRFGVALDLWAKENLVEFAQAASSHQTIPNIPGSDAGLPDDLLAGLEAQVAQAKASRAQVQKIVVMMDKRGIKDRDAVLDYVSGAIGRRVESRNELTPREASDLMTLLEQLAEVSS